MTINAPYQYMIYVIPILKGFPTVDFQENWSIVESLLQIYLIKLINTRKNIIFKCSIP